MGVLFFEHTYNMVSETFAYMIGFWGGILCEFSKKNAGKEFPRFK